MGIGAAIRKLRERADRHFVLVTEKNPENGIQPISLLNEEQLFEIADHENQTFEQVRERLTPLLVLEQPDIDPNQYGQLLSILIGTKARGAIVRSGSGYEVLSTSKLARNLNPNEMFSVSISVPVRTYICRQCEPPRRKRPASGGAPTCDRIFHGVMEIEV